MHHLTRLVDLSKPSLLAILTALVGAAAASANDFVVTVTDDSGAGSLRQAILDSNANPGSDTISFSIPGTGVHTISPTSALPALRDTVVLDGYTQPGSSVNTLANDDNAVLRIELNGTNAGGSGLTIEATNCVVRGLVINRFGVNGISVGARDTVVEGNFIGTDPTGTIKRPNLQGLFIAGQNTIVGGTTPTARNLISGNSTQGFATGGLGITNIVIQGNFIGTDVHGTAALGNENVGASIGTATNNVIGGIAAGAGNVISGNGGSGVVINTAGNVVQGNFIGTDLTGTLPISNHAHGVIITSASNNTIGGAVGNVIAFNGGSGVNVSQGTPNNINNLISANSIFSNGALGIDLDFAGVTLNDLGDADTGANNLQNSPVIGTVTAAGGSATITGSLNSAANTTYRLEFFANDTVDSSEFGEGKTFLGFEDVTTDAGGDVTFSVTFSIAGTAAAFTATATDPNGNTSEFSAAFTKKLLNISTRMQVLTDDNVLIGGFIVTGASPKRVIVRAIGPSLTAFGVAGALMDPTLELNGFDGSVTTNDNWKSDQQSEIETTGLQPTKDAEAAIVRTLPPGAYTAIVRGAGGTTGVGLVEAYDLDQPAGSKLANISTRGFIDTGDNVMIGGFIIAPENLGDATVLIRAIGPSLGDFGVANSLQNPLLELHSGNGDTIMTNDNWRDDQESEITATGLMPTDDAESAILQTLAPGNYTAIVRGVADTTGVGLVEVYHLE